MYVTPASRASRARTGGQRQFGSRNFSLPQGRLTLTANTPVMTSTASAQTTIRYTPYLGTLVPVWNGRSFDMVDIGSELTNSTTASSVGGAGPAAVTTSSNYDLFVWGNGILTRGPAWSSSSSRGTGAGTTELVRVKGVWVNANAITNGPPARRGTYVGTARTNGSSTVDWTLGTTAAGGGAAVLNVWNAYNRVQVNTFVGENTDTWTYATATWRALNNSASNSLSFVYGLAEDGATFTAASAGCGAGSPAAFGGFSIGFDSTSAIATDASCCYIPNTDFTMPLLASLATTPSQGSHTATIIEYAAVNTINMRGDWGSAYVRTGLSGTLRM